MIREKIYNEIITQGLKQSDIIRMVNEKGYKLNAGQLSKFLNDQLSADLVTKTADTILEVLNIELVRIM